MVADDLGNFTKKNATGALKNIISMYVKLCFKIFIAQNNNRF